MTSPGKKNHRKLMLMHVADIKNKAENMGVRMISVPNCTMAKVSNFSTAISLFLIVAPAYAQLDMFLFPFQYAYERALATYGEDYMEKIGFTQPVYDYVAVNDEEFDFVIVGAGPAGCALANRLSEVKNWKILLLEAGAEATVLNNVPALSNFQILGDLNWPFYLEKEYGAGTGSIDGMIFCPKGKGLGGCTLHNNMVFTRGNPEDYNNWEKLGNPGWGWSGVEPFFRKLENTLVLRQDYNKRGHAGPLNCDDVKFRSPSSDAWIAASMERGSKYVDFNGNQQLGTSTIQVSQKNGLRINAEKAYLRPAKNRPNLKILKNSMVTKILFNNSKKAIGVNFVKDGKTFKALAKKEVIVSAGTFQSAQLLMVSGVGPKDQLEGLGIESIADLKVGDTMYDHAAFLGLIFEVDSPITISNEFLDTSHMDQLVRNGTGVLTTILVEAITFLRTREASSTTKPSQPDFEFLFIPVDFNIGGGAIATSVFGINQTVYEKYYAPSANKNLFAVLPMHLHPESKGSLVLRTKNILDPPILRYPFLSRQSDVRAFIQAIRVVLGIVRTKALFGKYKAKLIDTKVPGCEGFLFNSYQYWECALRVLLVTSHHQVGTCRMGPACDPRAVVDNECKVHGISGLRVADASIIPLPLSAHTQVPTYMIGEKVAHEIKKKYNVNNV